MVKLPTRVRVAISQEIPNKPKNQYQSQTLWIWLSLFAVCGLFAALKYIDWEDGNPVLAPWRKEKLEQELQEIDNAEQYALKAGIPGYYPCYSCPKDSKIWLNLNEIWKYGVTSKSQAGRYRSGLPAPNLYYTVQYEGTISDCLKQEKIQIYHYPLLPENIVREIPLNRPPGNKIDR